MASKGSTISATQQRGMREDINLPTDHPHPFEADGGVGTIKTQLFHVTAESAINAMLGPERQSLLEHPPPHSIIEGLSH